jgi:hypothetical protein
MLYSGNNPDNVTGAGVMRVVIVIPSKTGQTLVKIGDSRLNEGDGHSWRNDLFPQKLPLKTRFG